MEFTSNKKRKVTTLYEDTDMMTLPFRMSAISDSTFTTPSSSMITPPADDNNFIDPKTLQISADPNSPVTAPLPSITAPLADTMNQVNSNNNTFADWKTFQEVMTQNHIRNYRFEAPNCGELTIEDFEHRDLHGRFPKRKVNNTIQFEIAIGMVKPDCKAPTMYGVVHRGASLLFKRKFLLRSVSQEQWQLSLGKEYPQDFDPKRILLQVYYSDGCRPHTTAPVPADGQKFREWLKNQVICGRDMIYYMNLLYVSQGCVLPPCHRLPQPQTD